MSEYISIEALGILLKLFSKHPDPNYDAAFQYHKRRIESVTRDGVIHLDELEFPRYVK